MSSTKTGRFFSRARGPDGGLSTGLGAPVWIRYGALRPSHVAVTHQIRFCVLFLHCLDAGPRRLPMQYPAYNWCIDVLYMKYMYRNDN